MALNYDALMSTTVQVWAEKRLQQQIFENTVLWIFLNKKGNMKNIPGGLKIVEPILYGANSTVGSYSDYDRLDTTGQEGITSAEFDWRQAAGSVVISGREESINKNSEAMMLNLLEGKIRQTELSMTDSLATMIYSDGSGNSSKDLEGLSLYVADTPTSGVVGGIDRATYSWWRNQSAAGTKSTTAFDTLQAKMRNMYNTCGNLVGLGKPDFITCDQDTYEGYESTLLVNERYLDKDLASGGFTALAFKGQPVVHDPKVPSVNSKGRMYFLNSNTLKLVTHSDRNFAASEFIKPTDQDAKISQILYMGNLTINCPAANGVIYDIDLT